MTKREAEARAAAHAHPVFPDTQEAFLAGYLDGHAKGVEESAKTVWSAIRNAAERMEHPSECALMADIAESAISAATEGAP